MIEIEFIARPAIDDVLARVKYGHLGLAHDNHPYVVPIHFGYDGEFIYIFTTKGKKTEIIDSNPEICLQVEEVIDKENWNSVMIVGTAKLVTDPTERERALESVLTVNPNLTPALSIRWMDPWVREIRDIEMIYRVKPRTISGRRTVSPEAAN